MSQAENVVPPRHHHQAQTGDVKLVNRLVIRDIEVENFKSYAGKHVIGPFNKTFTAVIGPNGSGKSNVIDSMLFVFGKSARKIRVEGKMADLIHNSAAHPNVPSASVTVNFVEIRDDPADPHQREEVAGSQLSITREVARSGASQYSIDHRRATQKEVVTLLLEKGVDLDHNRFLILQGEVEQIAMMKPRAEKAGEEGLVEYFDDLIGTNQLLGQIDEATHKAAEAFEARIDALDKMQSAKKELQKVEDAKNQCIEFVTKQNDLHRLVSVVAQQRLQTIRHDMQQHVEKLEELEENKRIVERRAAEHAEQVKLAKKAIADCEKERAKFDREEKAAQEERQKVEEELAAKRQQAENAEKARKRELDKIKKTRATAAGLREELDKIVHDIDAADRAQKQAALFIDENNDDFERQRDAVEMRLAPLRKKKEGLLGDLMPFERAHQQAEQDANNARHQLQAQQEQLERCRRERVDLMRRIVQCQERMGAIDVEVQQQEQETASRRNAAERLEEARAILQQHHERKTEIANVIELLKREAKDIDKDDQITSFLCAQRSLAGYLGPLRSLGFIDERFDIAAGVAGGAVWTYHVVDTPETATQAMELLKRENRGRASFLPLSKLAAEWGPQMQRRFDCPAGALRLFDLVRCDDEKLRPAFFFAVRNTVVAESLARARAIALNGPQNERCRAVTAHGEIVEPTGTITGGGQQKPKGAGLRGTNNKAAAASIGDRRIAFDQLTALHQQLTEVAEKCREAGTVVGRLEREMDRGRMTQDNARRLKLQRAQLEKEIADSQNKLETVNKKLLAARGGDDAALDDDDNDDDNDDENLSSDGGNNHLAQELRLAEQRVQEKHQALLAKRKGLSAVENEIASAAGIEYEQLRKQIDKCKAEKTELGKTLAALRSARTRTEAKFETQEKEATKLEERMGQAVAEEQERERELIKELQRQSAALEERVEEVKDAAQKVVDKLAALKKRLTEEQHAEQQVTTRIENFKKAISDLSDELKPQRQQLDKLEGHVASRDALIKESVAKYGMITLTAIRRTAIALRKNKKHRNGSSDDDDDDEDELNEEDQTIAAAFDVGRKKTATTKNDSKKNKKKQKKNKGDSSSSDDDDDDPFAVSQDKARRNKNKKNKKNNSGSSSSDSDDDNDDDDQGLRDEETDYDPATFTTRLSDAELATYPEKQTSYLTTELAKELELVKAKIDFEAVAIWNELDIRFKAAEAAHEEVNRNYNIHRKREEELKAERRTKFLATFGVIQHKLKEVYQTITRSGDAELELVDSSDPFEGIRFTVRPPRKAWKAIGNLSGGEKTLSSLALVFALHHIKPTPVYVLDEIDAALDFRNVAIVGKYILERGIGAQFIIISLRNNMFELAHQIVGISKVRDCTHSIVISPKFLADRISNAAHGRKTATAVTHAAPLKSANSNNPLHRHDYFGAQQQPQQQQQQQEQRSGRAGGFAHKVEEDDDDEDDQKLF